MTARSRVLGLLGIVALVSALLSVGGVSSPASAAPLLQCNGVGADGDGYDCTVTIANTYDVATGLGSSTVRTLVCSGPANTVFTAGDCTDSGILEYPELTSVVDQCNGTVEGGGGSLNCIVTMTNTIIGTGTPAIATVNQCNNSLGGDPPPVTGSGCDPLQATTDATITQCNDSVNGGGGFMLCTVGSSTISSAFPISIDQCNNSANGGGGTMRCSATITTTFRPSVDGTAPDELAETGAVDTATLIGVPLAALLLGALLLGAGASRRASVRAGS